MTAILLAIKAWSIWSRLGGLFSSVAGWAVKNPLPAALALSLLGNLATLSLWHWADRDLASANATITQFKAAQAQAAVIAQQALAHEQAAYQLKASEADNAYRKSLANAGASAARYIAAHRIDGMRAASDPRSTGNAIASAQGSAAKSSDGPSSQADMVAVKASDIDVCTINTERLQAVHDWALMLDN